MTTPATGSARTQPGELNDRQHDIVICRIFIHPSLREAYPANAGCAFGAASEIEEAMEGFSRLVLELYCAARETPIAEFQETALLLLKPALRFDSAIWGTGSVSELGMQVHTVHVHKPSPELITRSQQTNYQDRIAAEVMKRPGPAISFYSPTLRAACDSAALNLATRLAPRTHLVVASRDSASKLISWLTLLRKSGDRYYGHSERRELA